MAAKTFDELTINDDFMFGIVMREPKYCKPFLETILNLKIARIEYPEDQKTINLSLDGKGVRLDVYVEDAEQTVYNIEMQNTRPDSISKRTRYYQGMIDLNLLRKGAKYAELKKSLVIFVCTFDPFAIGRHVYTFENRCIEEPELALGDETQKIFLNTKGIYDDASPELKRLLNFIDGRQAEDGFTQELAEAVESVKANEKWRIAYMTLQEHYDEKYNEGHEEGLKQGMEQGIAQGIEQGIAQGIEQGIGRGRLQEIMRFVKDGDITIERGAQKAGMTLEQFQAAIAETKL